MRNVLLGTVVAASLASFGATANAADFAPAPTGSWTGLYMGIHGGYAWADAKGVDDRSESCSDNPEIEILCGVDLDGGFGGGQFGYNYQNGSLIFGIEADVSGADISGKYEEDGSELKKYEDTIDLMGTLRGRVGFNIFDDGASAAMLFVTGGLAWAHYVSEEFEEEEEDVFVSDGTASGSRFGYTVGGGAEWRFSSAWSVKAEYRYTDYLTDFGDYVGTDVDLDAHAVLFGVNFNINQY